MNYNPKICKRKEKDRPAANAKANITLKLK